MKKFILLLVALLLLRTAYDVHYWDNVFADYRNYNYLAAVFLLGVLATALFLEGLTVGWQRCTAKKLLHPSPSLRRDLICYGLDLSLFLYTIGMILSLGFIPWLSQLTTEYWGYKFSLTSEISGFPAAVNSILMVVIGILIVDFCWYWGHWLEHKIPALWELHAYHHSATEMTPLTTLRKHPLSDPIIKAVIGIPIIAFDVFTTHEYLGLIFAEKVLGHLAHSEIRSHWGWLGKIFVSPEFHRIHHSVALCHHDKNFGTLFSFWDRWFGTAYRGKEAPTQLGVVDQYYNHHHFFAEIMHGYFRAWHALIRLGRPVSVQTKD